MNDDAAVAARLQETREFLGFTTSQVSAACGWDTDRIEQIEDGTGPPNETELGKLARLYRRPAAWFRGHTRFEPGAGLLRKLESRPEEERDIILYFAEWLQGAGPAPRRFP